MSTTTQKLAHISYQISRFSIKEALEWISENHPDKVVFSSSFSFEDQVISHFILANNLPIQIFTLDTGRLFPETYSVWQSTNERYNTRIKAFYPTTDAVQAMLDEKGPQSFYASVEDRKQCCSVRKVEPLKRALAGNEIWITGLRAMHSPERENVTNLEWDAANNIIKFHPLLHWNNEEVKETIDKYNIPYNPLHDRGFVSIGCAPCTRAIKAGEDFRAGRWWWEDSAKKECGLHVHA